MFVSSCASLSFRRLIIIADVGSSRPIVNWVNENSRSRNTIGKVIRVHRGERIVTVLKWYSSIPSPPSQAQRPTRKISSEVMITVLINLSVLVEGNFDNKIFSFTDNGSVIAG